MEMCNAMEANAQGFAARGDKPMVQLLWGSSQDPFGDQGVMKNFQAGSSWEIHEKVTRPKMSCVLCYLW
jgi:hypothetical protein